MGGLARYNETRHGTWTQLPADSLDSVWCGSEFGKSLIYILRLFCVCIYPMGSIHAILPFSWKFVLLTTKYALRGGTFFLFI